MLTIPPWFYFSLVEIGFKLKFTKTEIEKWKWIRGDGNATVSVYLFQKKNWSVCIYVCSCVWASPKQDILDRLRLCVLSTHVWMGWVIIYKHRLIFFFFEVNPYFSSFLFFKVFLTVFETSIIKLKSIIFLPSLNNRCI